MLSFQRQNELVMDGIVGSSTWDAHYESGCQILCGLEGSQREDIRRIQNRLYETGYLATKNLVNKMVWGYHKAAVMKMQEMNGITVDGKVRTSNHEPAV